MINVLFRLCLKLSEMMMPVRTRYCTKVLYERSYYFARSGCRDPTSLPWTRWLDVSFVRKLEVQVSFDHL